MTIIVGLKAEGSVYMGADSAGTTAYGVQSSVAVSKLFTNSSMLFGCCGSYRQLQLIQYDLAVPEHTLDIAASEEAGHLVYVDTMKYLVSSFIPALRSVLRAGGTVVNEAGVEHGPDFLLGYDGRLFHVFADFQVSESHDPFDATGSGAEVALGALAATWEWTDHDFRVQKALEIASTYNAFCRPPFVYAHMTPDEDSATGTAD